MSRRSLTLALVLAFLVPAVLLAWIGLRTLREEARRGTDRYRGQAETLVQKVQAELDRAVSDLAAGRGDVESIPLRFDVEGGWLGESPASEPVPPPLDPLLFAAVAQEIDRLQARGELELGLTRLDEVARSSDDPQLVAWSLATRAALSEQLGRAEDASASRRALVENFPRTRDSRGLLRALPARLSLADDGLAGLAEKLAIYGAAVEDYASLEETATAEFLRRLRTELGEIAPADERLLALDRADAARARLRLWHAGLRRGVTDWVARGAPGDSATFRAVEAPIPSANPLSMEATVDPGRAGDGVFLVALTREGEGWSGGAALLAEIFERALERVRGEAALTSFEVTIDVQAEPHVGSAPVPVARAVLAPPFADYVAGVHGGDFGAFQSGERRRFAWTAGLVGLAIAGAALSAWLSLRAVAREVEAARGREAFVAAVTHELKTPLAAIRLFAEVLERGDVEPAKVREFGARTVAESDRLALLVDSVLDLARIEHGSSEVSARIVELRPLAESAVALVEGVARERGVAIRLSSPADVVRVRGDEDALTRAVLNLLDNALKYGEEHHPIEVEIVARADGLAELAVLDRGRGVPEAERRRIFEPFRRIGSELTRDRPGVGLGLALVAKIAAAHGGRAECSPRDGGGSRFALILPRVEAPLR